MKTIINFLRATLVIAQYETIKIIRAPAELFTRSVQPILWLLIFGQVFAHVHMDMLQNQSYVAYIAPGVMAQSVLFIAIFYGVAIIWERDLGILHKVLVSPASRVAVVFGKGLSAGVRAISQALVVYLLALILHLDLQWHPLAILGVIFFVILGAAIFATFSAIVACLVKTRERFMGIGQVIIMPLFFASNAIYPIALMPKWLQVVSHWNPLTYEIDALRTLMLTNINSAYGLGVDTIILLGILAVFLAIGGALYPRVIS